MFDFISRLRDPAIFQGNISKRHYFEGWYFKQVGLRDAKIAIIPGISLSKRDNHAFIQLFDGRLGRTHYFSYPIENFRPMKNPFAVEIEDNHFSYAGLEININDKINITGSLMYKDITPYRYSWTERGVMGWYGYIPFMETYHGLLSLDHKVNGVIEIDGDIYKFDDGKGYIEKDWGESFPSSWIWMQSNSFNDKKASLMLSIAVIPWLKTSFIGHLAIIRIGDRIFNLSTYRGGNITALEKSKDRVLIRIELKKLTLEVKAFQGEKVHLKSPQKGVMTGRTIESLDSKIEVSMWDKAGNSLFSDIGFHAGLEIMDDKDELTRGLGFI